MKYRGIEMAVGAFTLVGLAVVLFGIFAIRGLGVTRGVDYHVLYANSGSLKQESPVRYHGLLVGRVTDLAIDGEDDSRVRVTISVRRDTPVTTDTIAKITRAGLLGEEYIDLRSRSADPGTPDAMAPRGERVAPGGEIAPGEAMDIWAALERAERAIGRVDSILADFQQEARVAIATVNRILGRAEGVISDEEVASLKRAVADVADTAARVRSIVESNRGRIDGIVADASSATSSLSDVSARVDASLERLLPQVEDFTAELRTTAQKLQSVATTADGALAAVDVRQLNDMIENLEISSRNIAEFTREIKERPFRLIRKDPQPEKVFK
jgi:phospholipid/cholesterol/gamma-HCH transport system substrate-binding protein